MKKQSLLTILSLLFCFGLMAQETLTPKGNSDQISEEEMSQAIAKELKLFANYLNEEIEYPELSKAYNVEGRVVVRIVFDGEIQKFEIVESLNPECDKMVEEKIKAYVETWDQSAYSHIPKMTFKLPVDFSMAGL